jgi:hypothetical protein
MRYLLAVTLLLSAVAVVMNWSSIRAIVTEPPVEAAGGESMRTTGGNRDFREFFFGSEGDDRSFLDQFDTENLAIPQSEILRGGPPKDGIPAITKPRVVEVNDAEFLDPDDRVVGLEIDGATRAYPIRLLNRHEIINDEVESVPLAIVFCPLCDSVSVVVRRIDGQMLEFGVSGLLHNSNVILYDRTDDALWSQIGFRAISGPHAGRALDHLPFELTTFKRWVAKHPDSTVVTVESAYRRNYDDNPYDRYLKSDDLMFPASGGDDARLGRKEPVVGIQMDGFERAYPVQAIANAPGGRIEDRIGDERIAIEALDDGRHVSVVEVPEDALVVHTFWFAWASFHPQTTIFELRPQ